jgi:hypothetical protein
MGIFNTKLKGAMEFAKKAAGEGNDGRQRRQ